MTSTLPTLLYIDDDADLARLVERGLKRQKFAVELAPDGNSGLARIRQGGIDVVALDQHMPGLDGLETLAEIMKTPGAPPVVFVTASQDSKIAITALKEGASDYLVKDTQGDFVSFLIGCSFSFEAAVAEAGIVLRHVEQRRNVAMYRTKLACAPSGPFSGEMVVSMRPIKSRDVAKVVEISGRFPLAHGAPVHIGNPAAIGIADLAKPDYGDAVSLMDDEVPVFWACGVTPQWIAQSSRLALCITHAPGKMFVTDTRG